MGEDRKRRQELAEGGRQELAEGRRQELAEGRRQELAEGGREEQAEGAEELPQAPRLPERAAIYIAPDGTVHFGALFEGLLPVAQALTARTPPPASSIQSPAEKKAARPEAGDRGPGAA